MRFHVSEVPLDSGVREVPLYSDVREVPLHSGIREAPVNIAAFVTAVVVMPWYRGTSFITKHPPP